MQAGIGYVQYFTGLPWVLVTLHLLGACLVWVAVWRLRFSLTRREIPAAGRR
jgi:cytochrome c oxidase assembly protein subunit 15